MRVKITAEGENKPRLLRPYKQKILYANSLEHPVRFLPRLDGWWVGWMDGWVEDVEEEGAARAQRVAGAETDVRAELMKYLQMGVRSACGDKPDVVYIPREASAPRLVLSKSVCIAGQVAPRFADSLTSHTVCLLATLRCDVRRHIGHMFIRQ